MASTSIQPKLYIVQYDYVADALEKRKPYREEHLALMGKEVEKGNIIIGGAIGHPPIGAAFIVRNLSRDELEKFVQGDPYVVNGVVKNYSINPYMAVVGDSALSNDLIKI